MSTNAQREAHTPRAELQRRLADARRRTDAIFASLSSEAFAARPIAERHRLVFYLGHLEAFDWNLLCRDTLRRPARNPDWEELFAFGIDPTDGQLPHDQPQDWPPTSEVRTWGENLRADIDLALADAPLTGWLKDGWAMRIAVEHRLMHAETLFYLMRRLPHALKAPRARFGQLDAQPPANELLSIPEGTATLGLDRARDGGCGWDNEYARHRQPVPAFRVQRFATSNADYLRFVEDGGYRQQRFWSDADWAWREAAQVQHPAVWRRDGDRFFWNALTEWLPLPPAWPVWVSHAEASAYARWAGLALLTEAQWHRAALGDDGRRYPWGDAPPEPGRHGNFGFWADEPSPVDAHPEGQSPFGVHGLFGNGWQWTRTVFAPFSGFEPLPFYPGYSAGFFDGQHRVMKGASPATDVSLLRPSFRNWFQPHYPYAFAAIRCVEEIA